MSLDVAEEFQSRCRHLLLGLFCCFFLYFVILMHVRLRLATETCTLLNVRKVSIDTNNFVALLRAEIERRKTLSYCELYSL